MDININQAEVLPRSGIPIAAGLENVYISLAGLIGAGKTTLATALGELGLPVHFEPRPSDAGNLQDFYGDMPRCARASSPRDLETPQALLLQQKTVLVEREAACILTGR